jgi:stearoyl-CoA desaturase (delta-9 desaturase)
VQARIHLALFATIHVSVLAAFITGVGWFDVALCVGLYALRMFAITAGYHRYFAHKGYRTSRPVQFVLALIGTTAVQKGPLWWASTHRKHHRLSDRPGDPHSPVLDGFWESHVGWIVRRDHEPFDPRTVRDLWQYPELRWLDRYHWAPPLGLAATCFLVGGWSGLVWGFSISTVLVWHATFAINSLAHTWGSRRYATSDQSRNNLWLALLTFGEGWHNNHHHYATSARQGFFWWELDFSYYALRVLSAVGLVRELKQPPPQVVRPAPQEATASAVLTSERGQPG